MERCRSFYSERNDTQHGDAYLLRSSADPSIVREMVHIMGMLTSYNQSIAFFKYSLGFGEASTVVGTSIVSGFFAAAWSIPFELCQDSDSEDAT